MSTIARFFGKSPFAPLQSHMKKVSLCVKELPKLLEALDKEDKEEAKTLVKLISKLEHEADITKDDIRGHLPRSLFLPIDRSQLLEILSLQDSIADQAEDIAIVFTLHHLSDYGKLKEKFQAFFNENVEAVNLARNVIKEIDELIETSFGGNEAKKVKEMVKQVALKEHEIDIMQYDLVKSLYAIGETMDHVSFYHWTCVIREVGALSNIAEKLANRIAMVLEKK